MLKRILVLSFLVSSVQLKAQTNPYQNIEALLQMIDYAYVDTVNKHQIAEDAIKAILKDLDPHSTYIPAEDLKEVNEPLVGNFEGIGIQFNILNDTIVVNNTIPGGPSEKLGLRAGDRITTIDNENVGGIGIKNNDVVKKLRGPKGTKVTVHIKRRSEKEPLEFVITRDKIPLFSVDASYMPTPTTGYIKISRFADSTVEEFKKALSELKQKGMQNLILDLQGNGGGYLNRAIELADEFLSDDKLVVYTMGRSSARQENFSTSSGGFESGKLAILIDETSASASEIVSGAVQDWDRGIVIGRRSFGKGLVQKPFSLPDGSAVRLTIARYYTPSGRSIQKPYEPGQEDDYDLDLINRSKQGELFSADSIRFDASLKYSTNNKRTVYGGGGIMPDIFVPLDTMFDTRYLRDLIRKAVTFDFALNYVDENRKELNARFINQDRFVKEFTFDDVLMAKFKANAEKEKVEFNDTEFARSETFIRTQLKALIGRNLFGNDVYFEVMNELSPPFHKALEVMSDGTFERMKIAWR
ncbi:MAG TPA: S41 family peptidase [Bacteroidia bacterium]|nr:S41 family peptidase [Bacteroidia bacterium]HNT79305.1 S41 family peptidase [Bacteroidia bacterium]